MKAGYAAAPRPSYRLIPSQFPPVALFEDVAQAEDLEPVMELAGWTNDRLVVERLHRLPRHEWVYGRANASIVMAAFLHAAPDGARFNGPQLGAWYASASVATAIVEVAHHLRREAVARRQDSIRRTFRCYSSRLEGAYRDLRGAQKRHPELYAVDSHLAGQTYGEALRAAGEDGIVYDSVRHRGGTNVCAFRPSKVLQVTQAAHYDIEVGAADRQIRVNRR
ncbi:MAG TPA: RES family NAD+ phosphorylase [Devosiaceae bacterium]|nr:RES family NAD+ phosphorylase [Devosiaceae bacterium]